MPKAYPLTLYYVCCLVTIFSNIFLPLFFISRILVCAPLSWSTEHFPPAEVGGLLPEFFHARLSSERDIPAQACRFSCFFCAAYRLLLTQTRTQCSNSASRAIAMLEKTAKISPNACAGIFLSNECGHVENSYVFINDTDGRTCRRSCVRKFNPTKRSKRCFEWRVFWSKTALSIKKHSNSSGQSQYLSRPAAASAVRSSFYKCCVGGYAANAKFKGL